MGSLTVNVVRVRTKLTLERIEDRVRAVKSADGAVYVDLKDPSKRYVLDLVSRLRKHLDNVESTSTGCVVLPSKQELQAMKERSQDNEEDTTVAGTVPGAAADVIDTTMDIADGAADVLGDIVPDD